jgi:hypothetical protein
MLGGGAKKAEIDLSGDFHASIDQLWPLVKPMTLGALPVGIALAVLSYILVKPTVNAYQHRRRTLAAARETVEAR